MAIAALLVDERDVGCRAVGDCQNALGLSAKGFFMLSRFLLVQRRFLWLTYLLLGLSVNSVLAQQSKPQPTEHKELFAQDGAQAFPETAWAYLEIRQPLQWIEYVLEHPLRTRLEALDQVQAYYKSSQIGPLRLVVGILESQVGMTWTDMIGVASSGGLYLAVDSKTQGFLLVSRARDGETLSKIVKAILSWVDLDAANKKQPRPYEAAEHRTHRMIQFAGGSIARVNDWFLASNHQILLTQSMDRLIDASPNCLASLPDFAKAREAHRQMAATNLESKSKTSSNTVEGSNDAWAYLNLNAVRQAKIAPQLFTGRTNNPLGELLIGGFLDSFQSATHVTAALRRHSGQNDDQLHFEINVPISETAITEKRHYFFAQQPSEKQSFIINTQPVIAHLSGLRDLGAWWHAKEDLFDEDVIAQMALADSQFSTLFASLDFGEDVLTAFEPGLQLIVAEQTYADSNPDLKLPAIAFVGRLKDPNMMKRRLRIAFQSVIGFVNIQSSMEGMPPLDLMTQNIDGIEISAADFVLDQKSPSGVVQFNLSPAIAFVDDFVIISSGKALAQDLAKSAKSQPQRLSENTNAQLSLEGPAIVRALRMNRETLIAQNMLEQGSKREVAEQTIDDLLQILDFVDRVQTQIKVDGEFIQWNFDLRWDADNAAKASPEGRLP